MSVLAPLEILPSRKDERELSSFHFYFLVLIGERETPAPLSQRRGAEWLSVNAASWRCDWQGRAIRAPCARATAGALAGGQGSSRGRGLQSSRQGVSADAWSVRTGTGPVQARDSHPRSQSANIDQRRRPDHEHSRRTCSVCTDIPLNMCVQQFRRILFKTYF